MLDWYKANLLFIFPLVLILLSTIVLAEPPFYTNPSSTPFTEGLVIDYPKFQYYQAGENLSLYFHVYNISTGRILDKDDVSCMLHIYNETGELFYDVDDVETSDGKYNFVMRVNDTSLLRVGDYGWDIYCNTSYLGGFSSGNAELTATGEPESTQDTEDELFIYFVLGLAVLILVLAFAKDDHNLASISGMVLMVLGGYIIVNGFSTLTNTLSSGIGIVLIGVGFYILLRSNIEYFGGG